MKKFLTSLTSIILCTNAFALAVDVNEPRTIIADKIEYDLKSDTIKTTGNTEIINKSGQKMTLTDSYISQQGKQVAGDDIKIWLGSHVYVESDNITRDNNITVAQRALFTACDGCDSYGNAWEVWAYKIVHDLDKRILKFYNPLVYAYDFPVFWVPYFQMPDPGIKYKTGFLMPDFGSTNKMGTQINIPFYLNFSDTHDMTFTFSYLTKENPLFQVQHRLNADHSEYRTSASFTHNKLGENRWHIFNDDVIELGNNARATVFLARASDETYLQKYGFYNDQPYLESGGKLEVFGQSSYVVADAHIFQELRTYSSIHPTPDGNILPNIRATHQTAPFFKETFATFSADMLGISGDGTSTQRMIGDARITSPWTLWGGNRITASLSARYDIYHFNNTEMVGGDLFSGFKNRFLPSGYLEWGLPMFRPSRNWTQIIEPRIRLTAMRRMDAEEFAIDNDSAGTILTDATLFSDNRFAGLDWWENGTYADYGVRWAAFSKTNKSVEIFLGQSYDFTDRPAIDLNSGFHNGVSDYVGRISYNNNKWLRFSNSGFHNGISDYVGRISYNNNKWLRFSTRFRLNQEDLELRHIESSARIGKSGTFLNIGHIWSQNMNVDLMQNVDINEAIIGAGVKLSDRWSVRWNSVYNMEEELFQRHSGGLFYSHPCYYLSLQYRHDNAIKADYVGNTTFQFKFGMAIDGQQY